MAKNDRTTDLASTAAALESELRRFEELATAARKVPLTSEKNLERAARALTDVAASEERIAGLVRALVETIGAARERQQASAEAVTARAHEIEARTAVFQDLLRKFAALGEESARVNELVQEVAALTRDPASSEGPDGEGPERNAQIVARLGHIQDKMRAVIESAQSLAREADAQEMVDVARQADSLRQQIQAARNKLGLLQQSVATRTRPP